MLARQREISFGRKSFNGGAERRSPNDVRDDHHEIAGGGLARRRRHQPHRRHPTQVAGPPHAKPEGDPGCHRILLPQPAGRSRK